MDSGVANLAEVLVEESARKGSSQLENDQFLPIAVHVNRFSP